MASGGPPDRPARPYLSHSEPRPKRGRRLVPSQDTELSLNAELRRSEEEAGHRSLPNNLEWSFVTSGQSPKSRKEHSKKKGKHFEQVKLPGRDLDCSSPEESPRRRGHTPATAPRTRLPHGTPTEEREALERLKQQLFSQARGDRPGLSAALPSAAAGQVLSTANNERPLPLSMGSPATVSNTLREVNETELEPRGSGQQESDASAVDTSQVLTRLNQVREFLKQATLMFTSVQSSGAEEQGVDRDQSFKLARLIRHLKQQEKAYLELLQRTVAVEHDSTMENTPSMSLQSLTEEEKSESASIRDEELEGLRQQHSLLQKMLEQQKQLKELQSRQVALLALQRDAEKRLAEAEEGEEDEQTADDEEEGGEEEGEEEDDNVDEQQAAVGGARSMSGSEMSQPSGAQASASIGAGLQFTPEEFQLLTLLRQRKEQWRSEEPDDEKDKDEGQTRRQRKNQQPQSMQRSNPETESESADNEEAALALADATQERLQLENKLMALQAKKEQMDNLLAELHALREAQLRKESMDGVGGAGASVNVSKQEEDEPLATTSQKLDDDHILEALEVHQKLQKLQEVRDRLKQLRDLIGHYQPNPVPPENLTQSAAPRQQEEGGGVVLESVDQAGTAELEGAVGGSSDAGAGAEVEELDLMLNAGIGDTDLFGKLRQLQEARERVLRLKQSNANVQQRMAHVSHAIDHNQSTQTQTDDDSEVGTQTDTDVESATSENSSVGALAWQDDPEFQEKVRKLNNAKRKLKQLQELVARVQQFPENIPSLPSELAELSFDENGDDTENEDLEGTEGGEEEDSDEDEEDNTGDAAANQADGSVATGTEDGGQSASDGEVSLDRRRVLDLEGSDQEAAYRRKLLKQRAELEQLQKERQKLLAVQQELARISEEKRQDTVQKPPKVSKKVGTDEATRTLRRQNTFTLERDAPGQSSLSNAATQTPFYGADLQAARAFSVDSSDPIRSRPTSNALVFSELRRQRELHEEKLKKRRQKLVFEKKKKELDNFSEGGTYSVRSGRSGDMDEGFGVSMMSADITTATWGGSTQPSSTQNDSAVSADESDDELRRQTIPEVEDEYPDGIVQAEEEEEEHSDAVAFSTDPTRVFRYRERAPRLPYRDRVGRSSGRSGKKRKLSDGPHKREQERALTFDLGWPRTSFIGRDAPGRRRQENYTPTEEPWELHCNQLHQEISGLAALCANLQRDQQVLTSALNSQSVHTTSPLITPVNNPYQQYQQRQQEAYQGLQSYFTQQRYVTQQQQILQNLNQCYTQLQQQQQDMAVLQEQFQQLFSCSTTPQPNASPPRPHSAAAAFPSSFQQSPEFLKFPWEQAGNSRPFTVPSYSAQRQPQVPESWLQQARPTSENSQRVPSVSLPSTGPGARAQVPQWTEAAAAVSSSGGFEHLSFREHLARQAATLPVPTAEVSSRTGKSYNPNAYTESVPRTTVAPSSVPSRTGDVVGRSFPTPLRASAVASLAEKAGSSQRSRDASLPIKRGLDSVETSSVASSVPGDRDKNKESAAQDADRTSEAGSEFSLFEALRDSIYSEVATLISLNESRPHFLIELFRELQLLTSDYLRQRALYALQDLVTRFLTEDSVGDQRSNLHRTRFQAWMASNSELTPSEVVETSEDEEALLAGNAVVRAQQVTEGIYDYVENVESASSMSTPTSSHTDEINPFASEGLGDTVIHLDKALSKMREYERLRAEGKFDIGSSPVSTDSQGAAARLVEGDDVTTSSAGDVGSESSVSDVQYPRIDTQALDHQIKAIMSEVIPYLNEHMESVCTMELLGYIRDLVLSRIKVSQEQEFGRFFHKQLASILQDSLAKFADKKMKNCGEDILVDMSEILFNELAFYRLMKDLDRSAGPSRRPLWRQDYESGTDTGTATGQEGDEGDPQRESMAEQKEERPAQSATEEEDEATEGSAQGEDSDDEDEDEDEKEETSDESSSEESGAEDELDADEIVSKKQLAAEKEELGKSRDDAMAAKFDERPASLSGIRSVESEQQQCVKLELSVSESKPFSSTGSGEEDGEESFDDSDARRKIEDYEAGTAAAAAARRDRGNPQDSENDEGPQEDEPQGASAFPKPSHLQNGQAGDSQEEFEVSIDDLPTKLTGLTEADLQTRMAEEQGRTDGVAGVISQLDGLPELAGDPEALHEPDSSSRPVNGVGDVDKS